MGLMNVTWKHKRLERSMLLDYLNGLNFQPGQFFVLNNPYSPGFVDLYYVHKEEAM